MCTENCVQMTTFLGVAIVQLIILVTILIILVIYIVYKCKKDSSGTVLSIPISLEIISYCHALHACV